MSAITEAGVLGRPKWVNICLVGAGTKVVLGLASFVFGHSLGSPSTPNAILASLVATFAVTSGILFVSSYRDRSVFYLGSALLLSASAFSNPLLVRSTLAGLPLLSAHFLPELFVAYFFWEFAARFPNAPILHRYNRTNVLLTNLTATVAAIVSVILCAFLTVFIVVPQAPASVKSVEVGIRNAGWMILLALEVPAVGAIIRRFRLAPVAERRRARLFLGGLCTATIPIAVAVGVEVFSPALRGYYLEAPGNRSPVSMLVYSSVGFGAVVTAYSVLVRRILDVRLILRKALQYALARYTLLVISIVPVIVLGAFIYARRSQPMDTLVQGREAVILAGIVVAAFAASRVRRRLTEVLDRRFFREQYDARIILAEVVTQIRSAPTVQGMAEILRTQITAALAPEAADLFVFNPTTKSFVPVHTATVPLPTNSDLATLITHSTDALDTDLDSPDTPVQSLSDSEQQWLAISGIQLIVPVRGTRKLHGFVALGRRRNELPYSQEDRILLTTIASSAGLAVDAGLSLSSETPGVPKSGELAAACPGCDTLFARPRSVCSECGFTLVSAPVPYVLLDKFRFEKKLGSGGMGIVYRAVDLTLSRTVAIKTLPSVSPEQAVRLRREARAMASVTHPNLALIFGAETWNGQPHLIVEYMNDGTLTDRLRQAALPAEEAIRIGILLADVLGRLHTAGILHRDIKPSNIGFVAPNTPKLLDFGVAQLLRHSHSLRTVGHEPETARKILETPTQTAVNAHKQILEGTPAYMSPEVVNGESPSPSLDLWALSMVIYESLSLHNPMSRTTVGETLKVVAAGRVPNVKQKVPACPAALAAFLATSLSPDVRERPKSAREFQKRLEAVAAAT